MNIYEIKKKQSQFIKPVFCTKYRYRVLTGQIATKTRDLIIEDVANGVIVVSGGLLKSGSHNTSRFINFKSDADYKRKE